MKILLMFLFRKNGAFFWIDVTDFDNLGEKLPPRDDWKFKSYKAEIQKARPGQIFEFNTKNEDGQEKILYFSKKKGTNPYIGMWLNHDDVATLRAEHDAYEADRQGQTLIKKDGAKKYHLEDLDKIKKVYHKMPEAIKAQILAAVVKYIVKE